jgi:hypothetical protein
MKSREGLEEKRRFWERHPQEWKSSGLSVTEYCRRNKISPNSFHYWKSREKATIVPARLVVSCRLTVTEALHGHCS